MDSKTTIVDRIRLLANAQGYSLPTLEMKLNLGNGTISRWNKSSPNSDKLTKVADFFNVSTDYLLGRPHSDENDAYGHMLNIVQQPISFSGKIKYEGPKLSNEDIAALLCSQGISSTPAMKKIPLIGSIACGAPIMAEEHIEDYVDLPAHIRADFSLTCKGDSMINARIFDGDIVYIRQQDTVESGQIAAVLIDGEATLKRVRLFDDHIVLEPENPMYKPLSFWNDEMNTVRILGKAVAFTSAIR